MMTSSKHHPALNAPGTPGRRALFVDLDCTLLGGTVNELSDVEIAQTPLIHQTFELIQDFRQRGDLVVLSTRNDDLGIARFKEAHPETIGLFDEECGGNFEKSGPIHRLLTKNRIATEQALFVDDNLGERREVENRVNGIHVAAPLNLNN